MEGVSHSFQVTGGVTIYSEDRQDQVVIFKETSRRGLGETIPLSQLGDIFNRITNSVAKVPLAGPLFARGADRLTTLPFPGSSACDAPVVIPTLC